MSTTRNTAKVGITKTWTVDDELPKYKRRTSGVQEAYDFFVMLPVGKSAIIPFNEISTARSAARDFKKDYPDTELNFRNEINKGWRVWKETKVVPTVIAPPAAILPPTETQSA